MTTTASAPFTPESTRARIVQREWANTPIAQRLRCLREARRLLVDHRAELIDAVRVDVGKRADEVITQDILPTAEAFRYLEREAARLLRPQRVPGRLRPMFLMGQRDTIHRRPHGIVGIIGTWNYPIYLNAGQIAQALIAGNAVLWKPSEVTPTVARELHQVFTAAGFPEGLLQTLPPTREGGPQLLEADIDHLVFTGSAGVGRAIARRLGERLISSTLELSGCDAMFVLDDANLPMAAQAAWFGAVLNRGQTCLATRRILVAESRYPAFVQALRTLAETAQPVQLTIQTQIDSLNRWVSAALGQGAKRLTDAVPTQTGEWVPTILIDARPEMDLCQQAPFAPVAVVMPFRDLDDAVQMDEQCPYALGASIFTANTQAAAAMAARLRPGAITVNDVIAPTAHPATPFGGRGESGWGVTQGADGLLAMTTAQVISVRSGTFRPHYQGVQTADEAMGGIVEGALLWSHARSFGTRWRGLWRMIRSMMRMGKPKSPPR